VTAGRRTENTQLSEFRVAADVVGGRAVVSGVFVALFHRTEAHRPRVSVDLHVTGIDHPHAVLITCHSRFIQYIQTDSFILRQFFRSFQKNEHQKL